ncbi:MAG: SphA family protein [Geminicoccaceae bacterium]
MSSCLRLLTLSWLVLALVARDAEAAEGGYSNYVPGTYGDFAVAVAPDPGLTLRNDIYYYGADESRAVLQGQVRADVDIALTIDFLTAFYMTERRVLGGRYAFGAVGQLARTDIEAEASTATGSIGIEDDKNGPGDVTLIPWSLFWNFGNLHVNFAEYIVAPTGFYDQGDLANNGLNYWSFDTNIAMTYLDPAWGYEVSFDVGYIYNTENTDTDYQTGQEVHIDYMLNQYFSETSAIGVHGFYLDQVTGDSGSGAILGDFKGEAAGIGPALLWTPKIKGKDVNVIVKWLHEFHAEWRLEGDHVFASFALQF